MPLFATRRASDARTSTARRSDRQWGGIKGRVHCDHSPRLQRSQANLPPRLNDAASDTAIPAHPRQQGLWSAPMRASDAQARTLLITAGSGCPRPDPRRHPAIRGHATQERGSVRLPMPRGRAGHRDWNASPESSRTTRSISPSRCFNDIRRSCAWMSRSRVSASTPARNAGQTAVASHARRSPGMGRGTSVCQRIDGWHRRRSRSRSAVCAASRNGSPLGKARTG